ncbi:hypothetical protein [Enterobacter huaxiensis]|uniref:hypothetical protein n=2 Tax=Enterobacter TaxID=547 RepID=UPI0021DB2821|nr:hypothetical protein [Enterobacter huaxiensis]
MRWRDYRASGVNVPLAGDKANEGEMIDEKKVKNVNAPLLTSNSKVIQAADAALTALNKSFDDVIEKDYWLAEKMKKAALEAALASITIL